MMRRAARGIASDCGGGRPDRTHVRFCASVRRTLVRMQRLLFPFQNRGRVVVNTLFHIICIKQFHNGSKG